MQGSLLRSWYLPVRLSSRVRVPARRAMGWVLGRRTSERITPALGYAANMITVCVVIFLSLVTFIFWLGGLAEGTASESKAAPFARQTQPATRVE